MTMQNLFRPVLQRATRTSVLSSATIAAPRSTFSSMSLTAPFALQRQDLLVPYSQRSYVRSSSNHATEYYYDSQSGKHVPVHDESHVNILLLAALSPANAAQTCSSWAQQGLSGVVLGQNDDTVVEELYTAMQKADVPDTFQLWVNAALADKIKSPPPPQNLLIVHCVDYQANHDSSSQAQVQDVVSNLVQQKRWSAIVCNADDAEAITTASGVASILDATAGGGDYVYLKGTDGDAMVELAEELAYLDVEGPTLKARAVIDLTHLDDDQAAAEVVEECLMAGINKYVVDEGALPSLVQLVQEQGKTCNVNLTS